MRFWIRCATSWLRDGGTRCAARRCPNRQVGFSVWCRKHLDALYYVNPAGRLGSYVGDVDVRMAELERRRPDEFSGLVRWARDRMGWPA